MPIIIGILAGMGPKSTGPFIDQLINEYQKKTGAKNDIDFPPIIIYSLPTPFYADKPIDHALMRKTLCEGLKKLEASGVSFIAMACNSAHIYFDELQKCIHVPLLNIVEETLQSIPQNTKKISLLATRSTVDSEIYQKGLIKLGLGHKIEKIPQELIDDVISKIKTHHDPKDLKKMGKPLFKELEAKIENTFLVACTDLNVIFNSIQAPSPIIDSSLCLVRGIITKYLELTGR